MDTTADGNKATIYDVAAEAGVSIGTVSKVLSNTSRISATTREKVLQAVSKLNYVPSMAARGLTKGRTGVVGVLVPYTTEQLFNDPHLLSNLHGIDETLSEREYTMLTATARKIHDPASSYERLLRSRFIDGAIVMETQESQAVDLHRQLAREHYPWVVLGYPIGIIPHYSLHADDYQGAQQVAEHLLALGHRNIGIVSADPRPFGFEERLRGFRQILAYHKIPFDERLMVYGDMTIESGYKIAPKLLQRENRPTAIFALNDRMALGIMQWAQKQGWNIPQDLSIVGFDDIPAASMTTPQLTTIRQPAIDMGREAVKMLFQLLEGGKSPSRIVLTTDLLVRGSSGPVAPI
jgi:DNA-binding LacI/PurR family transcriptional regulator